MATVNAPQKPLTGKHVLMMFIAFFSVIIAVNVTMATLASTSWTGLVVKNSYVASQEFNGHLEASRAQDALGWSAPLVLTPTDASVSIKNAEGDPIQGAKVLLDLKRPIIDAEDQLVVLRETVPGTYAAKVDLSPVHWRASLRIETAEGVRYRLDHDRVLKASN